MTARYLKCFETGELSLRIEKALHLLRNCTLCPRECKVNRLEDNTGFCRTGRRAFVASYDAHFGEENPLVGRHGSGTIFFSHCNLGCVFCQNYTISHLGEGVPVTSNRLASMMVELQDGGCHNINFVTPSHVVPQILEALPEAIERGLTVPLVYNCGGYDLVSTLELLDGIIDIYMPDFKFWNPEESEALLNAKEYPERAKAALVEMHRQVGDLQTNDDGVATEGLLVRHLVMPGMLDDTAEILKYISGHVSKNTYVNIMDQYRPCGKADEFPGIDRSLGPEEYKKAVSLAKEAGLTRLDQRDLHRFISRLF